MYIIEREGEYPTPVYPSVVSLDRGCDIYNIIHTCGISLFVQSNCDIHTLGVAVKYCSTFSCTLYIYIIRMPI